tara:strand:+ start:66 stop:281 length:216 start_codon:yes stop_codon:yes gene_type:complete
MLIEVSDTKILGVPQSMYRMEDPIEGPSHERPWIVVMDAGEYGLTEAEMLILKDGLFSQGELMRIPVDPVE